MLIQKKKNRSSHVKGIKGQSDHDEHTAELTLYTNNTTATKYQETPTKKKKKKCSLDPLPSKSVQPGRRKKIECFWIIGRGSESKEEKVHFSPKRNGTLAAVVRAWAVPPACLRPWVTAEEDTVSLSTLGPLCNMELDLWMLSRMLESQMSRSKSPCTCQQTNKQTNNIRCNMRLEVTQTI